MGTNIGGVRISIGADVRKLLEGFGEAESRVASFKQKLRSIRLAAAIKGDPFSETRKYFGTMKQELDSVFSSWSQSIGKVTRNMGDFSHKSRRSVEKVVNQWEKLEDKLANIKDKSKGASAISGINFKEDIAQMRSLTPDKLSAGATAIRGLPQKLKALEAAAIKLKKIKPEILVAVEQINKSIEKFGSTGAKDDASNKALINNIEEKIKAIKKYSSKLGKTLSAEDEKILAKVKKFGKQIKKTYEIVGLSSSKNIPKATKEQYSNAIIIDREKYLSSILTKNIRLNEEMKLGYNIQANKKKILQNLLDIKNRGYNLEKRLSSKDIEIIKRYEARQKVVESEKKLAKEEIRLTKERDRILKEQIANEKKVNVEKDKVFKENQKRTRSELKNREEINKKELKILKEKKRVTEELNAKLIKSQQASGMFGVSRDTGGLEYTGMDKLKNQIIKDRSKILSDVLLKNRKINKEISMGINVDKNKERIARNLLILKEEGFKLSAAQNNIIKTASITRAQKEALAIERKRSKEAKKLSIEYNKLSGQIKLGEIPLKNIKRLIEIRNKLEKRGIVLSQTQLQFLSKYEKKLRKVENSQGVFGAKWLKNKAIWFLQLRGFWELYRVLGKVTQALGEFDDQMARAMRTARSELQSTEEVITKYRRAFGDMAAKHGASFTQIGEVLYQLGSAGLSAEENLSALSSTLSLIVGLEGDATETTKLIASIYRNFGKEIKNVTSLYEKFEYINDLIANTWKNHQIEIGEFTDALKHSAAMSKIAGVSLEDLSAILAVSHDYGIRAGNAGRALVTVWSKMTKESTKFVKAFHLGDVLDPTKPLDFVKVMDELYKKFKGSELSVYALGAAFKRMGLRGVKEFETILQHWDRVKEAQQEHLDMQGEAERIEIERLNHIGGAWDKFVGNLKRALTSIDLSPLTKGINALSDALEKASKIRTGESIFKEIIESSGSTEVIRSFTKDNIEALREYGRLIVLEEAKLKKSTDDYRKYITAEGLPKETLYDRQLNNYKDQYNLVVKFLKLYEGYKIAVESKEEIPLREEYVESIEEKALRRRMVGASVEKELVMINDEIIQQKELMIKHDEALQNAKRKYAAEGISLTERQTLEGMVTALSEYQTKLEEQENKQKSLTAELNKQKSIPLQIAQQNIKAQKQQMEYQAKILNMKGLTEKEAKTRYKLNIEEYELSIKSADNAFDLLTLENSGNKIAMNGAIIARDIAKNTAEEKLRLADLEVLNKRIATRKREITIEVEKTLNTLKEEKYELEKVNADNLLILDVNKRIALVEKSKSEKYKELTKDTMEQMRLYESIRQKNIEILKLIEAQKRASNLMYDVYKTLEGKIKSFRELSHDLANTFAEGMGAGLGDMMFQLSTGFQENQQEVVNLKGELKELKKEKDELTETGILSADEAERLKEVNKEMSGLKGEINDLENPVKSLGDIFKSFFKDLIDGINQAITKWIAMKIVMGIVGAASGGSGGGTSFDTQSAGPGWVTMPTNADGGILGNITSFKKFSNGGTINSPTLAAIGEGTGDNREIVVPMKNIKQDHVEGYMKDSSEPVVNVINVITEDDLAAQLAKPKLGQIIVNRVYQNTNNQGILSRR